MKLNRQQRRSVYWSIFSFGLALFIVMFCSWGRHQFYDVIQAFFFLAGSYCGVWHLRSVLLFKDKL